MSEGIKEEDETREAEGSRASLKDQLYEDSQYLQGTAY